MCYDRAMPRIVHFLLESNIKLSLDYVYNQKIFLFKGKGKTIRKEKNEGKKKKTDLYHG